MMGVFHLISGIPVHQRLRRSLYQLVLVAVAVSVVSCGGTGKERKTLEKSRLDVLGQVRQLRIFSSNEVHVGDLITGNYRMCKEGGVGYIAGTNWFSDLDAKKRVDTIGILTTEFARDGWSVRNDSGSKNAVLAKGDASIELNASANGSIVNVHVMGKCQEVGSSADNFLNRPVDEYDK